MSRLIRIGATGPDVRLIQEALNRVFTSPPVLKTDGIFGPKTQARVIEFQRRQRLSPDGIVGPLTSAQLMPDGGSSEYNGFSDFQRAIIQSDLDLARRMLDVVNVDLVTIPQFVARTSDALFNVFDIDLSLAESNPIAYAMELTKLFQLKAKFARLRAGLDEPFPKKWDSDSSYAAYVIGTGPTSDHTVHFSPLYFSIPYQAERAATLIHERAHTLCQPPRDTRHPGTADAPAGCIIPHEDKAKEFVFPARPFHDEAIRNPWCFEWFSIALQRNYSASWYRVRNCGGH